MNHQLIKTWILSEESLLPEQVEALHAHLATCASCQNLASSWQEVRVLLNNDKPIQPGTGFAERWRARYISQSRDLSLQKQRQSWWFFLIASALAGLLFILLVGQVIGSFNTPMEVLLSVVYLVSGAITSLTAFQSLVMTLINTTVAVVPPLWWIVMIGLSSVLIIIWLISLRLVLYPRRVLP